MRIIKLSFIDRRSGWNIRGVTFNALTLLVGASGVGKTQILNAVLRLVRIAEGKSGGAAEWTLDFETGGLKYRWEGAFAAENSREDVDMQDPAIPIEYERLYRINGKEELLIDRVAEKIVFKGTEIVKLEATKSIVSLLKEEPDVMPVHAGLMHVYALHPAVASGFRIPIGKIDSIGSVSGFEDLRKFTNLTPLEKLFLLYKNRLREYEDIVGRFVEIFPFVEAVEFTIETVLDRFQYPVLRLKERDVEGWIPQNHISAGMLRTLIHIIVIALAEDGDVILIDEFENGLGVNCIEEVADMVINPVQELQFVITSHHPYVINNIDYRWWKIVTRRGSDVSVHTADDLRIGDHSRHDAFLQLVQSLAYQTGTL